MVFCGKKRWRQSDYAYNYAGDEGKFQKEKGGSASARPSLRMLPQRKETRPSRGFEATSVMLGVTFSWNPS